ncbi:MAG: hypothetical protein KAU17_16630 [Spirochaetales bacterium]|jgi:hypothetical protein|nr:hypothetical protein [Spirochaetales bacterium]
MSYKLTPRNGEIMENDRVIEALVKGPDRVDVLEALRSPRQDKVRAALDQTVKTLKKYFSIIEIKCDRCGNLTMVSNKSVGRVIHKR